MRILARSVIAKQTGLVLYEKDKLFTRQGKLVLSLNNFDNFEKKNNSAENRKAICSYNDMRSRCLIPFL